MNGSLYVAVLGEHLGEEASQQGTGGVAAGELGAAEAVHLVAREAQLTVFGPPSRRTSRD